MKRKIFTLGCAVCAAVLFTACSDNYIYSRSYLTQTVNVENSYVQMFMARGNATFSNEKSVYDSDAAFTGINTDQPAGYDICFQSRSAGQATVTVAFDAAFDSIVVEREVALKNHKGSYRLTNMVPGCSYFYRVLAGADTLAQGTVHATGQVRMIALDHAFNIRDLGGWTGWNGRKLRYGELFRGGSLGSGVNYNGGFAKDHVGQYAVDDDDCEELRRLGVRAQLDLRAVHRSGKYNDASETSFHSYSDCVPMLTGADFCNIQTDYGAYAQDASLISDVAWVIYELRRGNPVYFNCRQGADRTGALAFILEGLLGCYDYTTAGGGNQMAMDYELTGFSCPSRSDNLFAASYRPACEAYANEGKIFYQLLNDVNGVGGGMSTVQERCYYYLNTFGTTDPECFTNADHNRYVVPASLYTQTVPTEQRIAISRTDLDWFVNYMLGITDRKGHVLDGQVLYTGPAWAKDAADIENYDLRSMAEKNANAVYYAVGD